MTQSDRQWEFLQDVAYLIFYAKSIGLKLTGGDLNRTSDQQILNFYGKKVELVDSKPVLSDKARVSWTMRSYHLKRQAIDLNLFVSGKPVWDAKHKSWITLGRYWEDLHPNNRWGGFWKTPDAPHFERRDP